MNEQQDTPSKLERGPISRLKRLRLRLRREKQQRRTAVREIKNKPIVDWLSGKAFSFVHGTNLVYNTCWEDPRLDHEALQLTEKDRILVITSAGCNALDYAIKGPAIVHAVDMNPRQNALLELKIAAIKELEYEDFFQMFGRGRMANFRQLLREKFRPHLNPWSYQYWNRKHKYFTGKRSFYFRGSSGSVARFLNSYINRVAKIRPDLNLLLDAKSLEEQKVIYDRSIGKLFWTGFIKRVVGSHFTLSLLGVPRQQRQQVELHYGEGISQFAQDCMEAVFTKLPIHDNYFWRVYITGEYTKECCPEYLKEENFRKLKDGLVNRVKTHTSTVEGFLRSHDEKISRFILLDHMDWLSTYRYKLLESEWQAIVDRATPDARVLYRSGGTKVDYVEPIEVIVNGEKRRLGDLLTFNKELAAELHEKDRVHTYGCFYIADLNTNGRTPSP